MSLPMTPTPEQIATAITDAIETLGGTVTEADRERFAVCDVNFTAIGVVLGVSAEAVLEAFTDALRENTGNDVSVFKKGSLH